MTFSIVARSEDGESWGIAVASKFLGVGAVAPAAVAGVGAISTQAHANIAYKYEGLALLDDGATAQVALDRLLADDPGRDDRQVGIVDGEGSAVTWTGSRCYAWAGGVAGDGYAIQGNILTGPEVLEAMQSAWVASVGRPLADRLVAALAAGDQAGGDSRGRQSAALLVVKDGAGYGGADDVAVDLRVDDHTDPVAELARLLELHDLYGTASSPEEQVPLTDELRAETEALARAAGYADLRAWVAAENYEMRVAPGDRPEWIDARVLAILRGTP